MSLKWNDPKDPADVLDYHIDCATWLQGDTLASVEWDTPEGLLIKDEARTDTLISVWFDEASTVGKYACTLTLTTAAGRTAQRTVILVVKEL